MPTKTIPLFGSFSNRGDITKDQEFINCFPQVQKNPISGKGSVDLYKRTGTESCSDTNLNNTSSFGACVWDGSANTPGVAVLSFVISAGTSVEVWKVIAVNTVVQVGGDISTTNNCLFLNDTAISGTANLTGVFVDSSTSLKEVWYFPEGGAWTQITDGDFPPNQGTPLPITPYIAHMDGYMFVMCVNGQIWNSDINSLANWTATSFLTANAGPDGGVGIARYKDYIVGFGKKTVQFFYNAGNPVGSPLSPVANSTINIGALPVWSTTGINNIKVVGDTVYWIGIDGNTGKKGIYRLNGMHAEKVSNQTVEKLLDPGLDYFLGICGGFYWGGKQHVMFYSGASNFNFCYCIDTDFWWTLQLASQTDSIKGIVSAFPNQSVGIVSSFFNGYSTLSNVYRSFADAGTTFTDATATMTATVRTNGIDLDTDEEKFVTEIWLDADTQASGTATLECSDDDYASWVTLGTFDMTKHEKRITRCGSHTGERAYRLTHSANTAFRARAIRIKYATA